jgi:VWFA-related protein
MTSNNQMRVPGEFPHSPGRRVTACAVSALFLLPTTALPQEQDGRDKPISLTITNVIAPTIVTDEHGSYVNGLQPHQFRLFDNEKQQDIKVDVAYQPISLVVAVQANSSVEPVLSKIKNIAPLLEPLVAGEQGEVAVMCFDHRVQTLQDFTSDPQKIKEAFAKIKPGSQTSAMIDAVESSSRLLSHRPKDRRRILLLVSETRDKGSEGKLRETLLSTEINNILVYTININRLVTTVMAKTPVPRPDPIPSTARNAPAGGTNTPNTVMQNSGSGSNVLPVFKEIFLQVKAIFVDNPAEVFTKFTGGHEYPFLSQRNLEEAVSKIGEDLHSQYLISYNPNNKIEGGWHAIRIEVTRPNVKVRTRPGYWLAGVPE